LRDQLIRTSLTKHLEENEIETDVKLDILVLKKQDAPVPENSYTAEDWISDIASRGDQGRFQLSKSSRRFIFAGIMTIFKNILKSKSEAKSVKRSFTSIVQNLLYDAKIASRFMIRFDFLF